MLERLLSDGVAFWLFLAVVTVAVSWRQAIRIGRRPTHASRPRAAPRPSTLRANAAATISRSCSIATRPELGHIGAPLASLVSHLHLPAALTR